VGVPIYFTTSSNQLNHPFTPARLLQLEKAMEMDDCMVLRGNNENEKSHVNCWRNAGQSSDNIANLNESVDDISDQKDTFLSFQETSSNATLSPPEISFGRELSFNAFQFTSNNGLPSPFLILPLSPSIFRLGTWTKLFQSGSSFKISTTSQSVKSSYSGITMAFNSSKIDPPSFSYKL
jgi:hypothetical protein